MSLSLASWNVNGLRACIKKGFNGFLESNDFDVVALQEIKMLPEQADFAFEGYNTVWNSAKRKGYAGTCTLSRGEPISVIRGTGGDDEDEEGRALTLEFGDFYFVNVYSPNSKDELKRLDYRMEWQDMFCDFLRGLSERKHVIVCGDLNVAHKEIDLKHPKRNVNHAGFTPEERSKMDEIIGSGFVDTFRLKYPDKTDAYTWWSFIGNTRANNTGWRIDYFLVSSSLESLVEDAVIYIMVLGSDHCPVGLELNMANLGAD